MTCSKSALAGTGLGPRLALSPDEAAAVLGVSRDYFDQHVIGELRIVRRGRRILVALTELERWLDRAAARRLTRGREWPSPGLPGVRRHSRKRRFAAIPSFPALAGPDRGAERRSQALRAGGDGHWLPSELATRHHRGR